MGDYSSSVRSSPFSSTHFFFYHPTEKMTISKAIERTYDTWIGRWTYPRLKGFLTNVIRSGDYIPAHVAFIMDGNRRYARQQNMSIAKGHELGSESMSQVFILFPSECNFQLLKHHHKLTSRGEGDRKLFQMWCECGNCLRP